MLWSENIWVDAALNALCKRITLLPKCKGKNCPKHGRGSPSDASPLKGLSRLLLAVKLAWGLIRWVQHHPLNIHPLPSLS